MKLAAFVLGSIPLLIQFYARKYLDEDRINTLNELEKDLNLPRIKEYDFIDAYQRSSMCSYWKQVENPCQPLKCLILFNMLAMTQAQTISGLPFHNGLLHRIRMVIISHLGKMLGGSGSHNDMVHNRGSPKDYDNYAEVANDSSWRYENVLEHFKKYENFIGELFTGEHEENYGHEGPITIDTDTPPFLPIWFDVANELGYKAKFNYSCLLDCYTESLRDCLRATWQIAHASKEVIISSGIFSSPLLLMKSGVGPRDQLEEAGIAVKHELASVGQNLIDHLIFDLNKIQYNASIIPYIPRMPDEQDFEAMIQKYHETGEGILGYLNQGPQAFIVSSRPSRMDRRLAGYPNHFVPMCPFRKE
ncbi:Oxygen-dependent choline dehydrogenase [Orchesella cincta]|uniref:Oxygen-dependent choline dehydrogenase n=1 Tax=Orchesella cincta TaxID=48709 RepID=A0A1D2M4M3_ORCCI|nr:Oxygen-dependent choline dehydrogenase [Orchesella cincta]